MQPLQQIQWSQKLNKLQKKSQKMEHRYIVTLHRERLNNLSEMSTETFESGLQCQISNFVNSEASR